MYSGVSIFETLSTFNQIYLLTSSGISFLIHKSLSEEKSLFSYSKSNFSLLIANNSLIIQICENKSGLWFIALLSTSNTASFFHRKSLIFTQIGELSSNIIIQICLSFINPNSSKLQIIHSLVSPLIFVFLITKSSDNLAQITAIGTFIPTLTLGAQQTICFSSPKTLTLHIFSFSLSGCLLHSKTSQINISLRFSHSKIISSTSAVL